MCTKKRAYYLYTILSFLVSSVSTSRILGIFPMLSHSHEMVIKSYITEVAEKGHELIIISPYNMEGANFANITAINIKSVYGPLNEKLSPIRALFKRGVIMNEILVANTKFYKYLLEGIVEGYNKPDVLNLINDREQKFDLILVEGFFEYHLIFSEIFKAPVIMFSPFMGFSRHYEMMGGIGRHPIYYPNFHRTNYDNLGVWGTLRELYNEYRLYEATLETERFQDELLKKNFGPNAPTTSQLKKNVDLLFLTVHPMLANNRPVPPNIIYLHAPHLTPVKDLPQDLKTYLDNSKTGVIYVSLGTHVNPLRMHKEFYDVFMKAFATLPFDILWKFEGKDLSDVPKNVKVQKWFPQWDLLHHPNVTVFVTQAGIQSTIESIDAGVPLVGVPITAEQFYNAQKIVDFKIGVKLDPLSLTADDLVQGVKNVIESNSYKDNIVKLGGIFRDDSQKPLERAVWWTEYVLRHRGAKHLRPLAADASIAEYYMLNYVFLILGTITFFLLVVSFGLYLAIKRMFGSSKTKMNAKNKSD